MAAVAGEAARLVLNVDVGGLRGSSGYKKQSYDFLVSSSSSLAAQLPACNTHFLQIINSVKLAVH
jgi:hypothetical protein